MIGEELRCRRLAWRVQGLAADLAGRQVAGKDPEIRRARVEIEVERLGRRADCDGRDPGNVPGLVERDCRSGSCCSLGLGRFLLSGKGVDGLDQLLGHFGAVLEVGLVRRERAAEVGKLGIAHLLDRSPAGLEVESRRRPNLGGKRSAETGGRQNSGKREPGHHDGMTMLVMARRRIMCHSTIEHKKNTKRPRRGRRGEGRGGAYLPGPRLVHGTQGG